MLPRPSEKGRQGQGRPPAAHLCKAGRAGGEPARRSWDLKGGQDGPQGVWSP